MYIKREVYFGFILTVKTNKNLILIEEPCCLGVDIDDYAVSRSLGRSLLDRTDEIASAQILLPSCSHFFHSQLSATVILFSFQF